jgi:hypothetical protein
MLVLLEQALENLIDQASTVSADSLPAPEHPRSTRPCMATMNIEATAQRS